MAIPGRPESAVFFIGILASDMDVLDLAAQCTASVFGPPDLGSLVMPFGHTDYYAAQIGPDPVRAFLAFPGNFHQGDLAHRKLATNRMESELSRAVNGRWPRPVNLDPGYLTLSKLVLASAKNFSHRIFLSDGIYAEVTLQYTNGNFTALPWTFPDYASGAYRNFFLVLRERLKRTSLKSHCPNRLAKNA